MQTTSSNRRSDKNRRGLELLLLVIASVACYALVGGATRVWAQSGGAARPGESKSRVLSYVPARKGQKAHVVFTPPSNDFKTHKNFRLRTPQGDVVVHCEPFKPSKNPRYAWASEISYPIYENLYYFRSPTLLPIHLLYNYGGDVAPMGVHTVRVNGTDVYRAGAPIVMKGKWNKLSILFVASGGD